MKGKKNCSICDNETNQIFTAEIIKKYNIEYFLCPNCGLLQTEDPFWLAEVYKNPINACDTGVLARSVDLSKKATVLIYLIFDYKANYLDYAGGYGIFTRLMRDIGYNFFWYDPYSPNLVARGFEYKNDMDIELITSFETFEHFPKPLVEIDKMLSISRNLLFTTLLLPEKIPDPDQWWYYGMEHGQHISFYSLKTLKYIAQKYGLILYSNNENLHLLSEKSIDNNAFYRLINSCNYINYRDMFKLWEYLDVFIKKDIKNILKIRKKGIFEFLREQMSCKTSQDMEYLKNTFREDSL